MSGFRTPRLRDLAGTPALWQTLRILIACLLAYGLAALVGLPDRFWAMVTAIVVMQPALDATLSAGRDRILGTMLGALAGLGVIGAARHGWPLFGMFWVALVPLAILTALWPNLRLGCITLVVVVLVPSTGGLSFARPLDRVLEILLGTLVSIVVSVVIFPGRVPRGG